MNTYIWTSEYELYIASGEDEKVARDNVKAEFYCANRDYWDIEDFKKAIKEEPLVLQSNSAVIISHANE